MSSACGCSHDEPVAVEEDEERRPWYRDPGLMLPIGSGVFLVLGLLLHWLDADLPALASFWVSLLLGAWTFVPGAIRKLVTRGSYGIGLLMTISAVGAVSLGYVEEAAALAFLYSLAEALEDKAMDRARSGLRSLLRLVPETATVLVGGAPREVAARELAAGQIMLVRPGERVATDGVVRSGHSALDTSAITGESIPVEVEPGSDVPAGTINTSGALEVEATTPGSDNSLTTIVRLVEQAQAEKGTRARIADRIAKPLVPVVILLALAVGIIGSLLGDPTVWITRALVVLVAASPCAIAIAVPITVISGIGGASRLGIVIKSGAAFEEMGRIRHVAMDKTGTLTRNEPTVARVFPTPGFSEGDVLAAAAAVERHSTHPLATAIADAVPTPSPAAGVTEEAGRGVTGTVDSRRVTVGSPRWIDAGPLGQEVAAMEAAGQTCVLVEFDGEVAGAIGVRDELRPESAEAVSRLGELGLTVSMLTGDNARTAAALARDAGIDDVQAELRPEDKARIVADWSRQRPTSMIGDGINDAPALAAAIVGVAMGARGSDAAVESADVAFTGHDLCLIPTAFDHARRGRAIIDQNIVLSLAIIAVLPPLAVTGVLGLAAVVLIHEVAEVLVILNGLRAARLPRGASPAGGQVLQRGSDERTHAHA